MFKRQENVHLGRSDLDLNASFSSKDGLGHLRRRLNEPALSSAAATLKHYECYNEPHYERNTHYEFRGAHNTH